ncbi:hypothetical protein IPZ58_05235 [Streptomyces roseoverticillatus]|uniref:hypothetical protein n=1 Tax=Streptomyces roseoverticillatus TaxID=66429 RepID=UPI001F35E994|nr:hypothetical protein [Streptomyces roseoverticillatus]MCF3100978.1 hypothetical protein [Streptomyces roseoverticillatus]
MSELERNAIEWARHWADQVDVELSTVMVVVGEKHSLITSRFGREDRFEAIKVAMRYVDHGYEASLVRNDERGLDVRVKLDNRLFTHLTWSAPDDEEWVETTSIVTEAHMDRWATALQQYERGRAAQRQARKAQEG